ncbi:ABC transporter permease [Salmonella enterica subsp. enterica]|nr:ABC transporter permease [Salmonella enterica subsp. enterica serovar Enteritidis]
MIDAAAFPSANGRLRGRLRDIALAFLSVAILIGVWSVAAHLIQSRELPPPGAVFRFMLAEALSGELWFNLGITLLRVAVSFIVAMALGAAIGIALGLNRTADRLFDPWLILLLNLPALVVIVLAYIWLGLNETAAIGAVALTKVPNVAVTMREGARALDPQLGEMAKVFRFPPMRVLRHVILPQLQPYFAAATRSGVALIWKIVLVVELLGRPNGVGFQIYTYFQLFDVRAILAYSLAFVAVMLLVELLFVQPLERRATRWRKRDA